MEREKFKGRLFDFLRYYSSEDVYLSLFSMLILKYRNDAIENELFLVKQGNPEEYQQTLDSLIPRAAQWSTIIKDKENAARNVSKAIEELLDVGSRKLNIVFWVDFPDLPYAVNDLLHLISQVNLASANFRFGDLFDDLLRFVVGTRQRHSDWQVFPDELAKLMIYFLPNDEKLNIYNPFMGLGSLLINLPNHHFYHGQELNQTVAALAELRAIVHGKRNYQIKQEDVFSHWMPPNYVDIPGSFFREEEHYLDVVLSVPPYGAKVPGYTSREGRSEHIFLEKIMRDLSKIKKAIVLMPSAFLMGRGKKLRESLIDNDWLEVVIGLPTQLLGNTSMPTTLLIFSEQKKYKGKVKIVDASQCFMQTSAREREVGLSEVIDLVEAIEESEYQRLVTNEEIKADDYDLHPPRYLGQRIEDKLEGNFVALGELISFIKPIRLTELSDRDKVLSVKDLSVDVFDSQKSFDDLEGRDLKNRRMLSLLKPNTLVLTLMGTQLKATHYLPSAEMQENICYVSSIIQNFELKESIWKDKISFEYLVQELHEEYIDEQLQKYRSGMTMPRVSTQDFLKYIKVRVIPLEEQKAKVEAIRGVATKVAELEKEKEAALKGQTQQEYKEFASLKHTISQSLHKASTAVELLRGFIKDLAEEGASLPAMDAKIDDEGGPTMNDLFSTALRHLQVSSDILEENEQAAIDLSNYPLAPLNFKAFIKKTCAEEKKLPKTKFEMYLYIPEDTTDEGKIKKYINSHEELLGILFGNIFDNAKRHAFVDNNKKYKLRVEVRFAPAINNLPCVVVEIGNNGKPFPEKFGKEELITKNRKASNTGHSGIGGSDIDKIIKHHKGEFELLLGEDEEFVTIYQIKIPLVYDKG